MRFFLVKDGREVKNVYYNSVIYYISISYINIIQYFTYSSHLAAEKNVMQFAALQPCNLSTAIFSANPFAV